jgi:hypothetical protein
MIDPKDHDPPQTKKNNTLDLHRESLQSLSSSQLRSVYGGDNSRPPENGSRDPDLI